jgi:hypothetical protein
MQTRRLYAYDTPAGDDAHAVQIELSPEDSERWEALTYPSSPETAKHQIEVTDQQTGQRYKLRRWPCGASCFCAAQLEKI